MFHKVDKKGIPDGLLQIPYIIHRCLYQTLCDNEPKSRCKVYVYNVGHNIIISVDSFEKLTLLKSITSEVTVTEGVIFH